MRFMLLATSLIGFASAKLKPVLRHKKDVMDYKNIPDTVEECEQMFNALDKDNSGSLSLGDVEVVSQNLSQVKRAELTDALAQMLYGTGITSIQDDFSLSHADYMYFCMNSDDMEAAIAKRAEMKKKAKKEKGKEKAGTAMKEKLAVATTLKNNNIDSLQASCRMRCPEGEYCGSGGCRPNGSCLTLNDCLISNNVYAAEECAGEIECNALQCTMNCRARARVVEKERAYNNNHVPNKEEEERQSKKKKDKLQNGNATCQAYFQAMDKDKDGLLTYTEFTTFLNENGFHGADYDEMVLSFGSSEVTYTENEFC